MKTVLYIRVSSLTQNLDRQIAELTSWAKKTGSEGIQVITEKVSGSVLTSKRKFNEVFSIEDLERVVVQDIDRLGRDTIDILNTIKKLTEKGINLTVTSLGMNTLLPNGKENDSFKIVLSVMATLAELERKKIKERQAAGIKEAQKRGAYKNVGRKKGSTESTDQVLDKYPNVKKQIKAGLSLRKVAKLCDVSVNTVRKVKEAINS